MSSCVSPFTIERAAGSDPGAACLRLSGELDHSNSVELEAALFCLAASFPGRVVVDCAALTFVDASGLDALAAASLSLPAPLELRDASPMLRRMITICRLDKHLVVV